MHVERGRAIRILATALLLLSVVTAAQAQTARLAVPVDSVSIGERFQVGLILERPATAVAIVPDPARGDTLLGDLEILDLDRSSRELPGGSGFVRDSILYQVTTFALDTAFVPSVDVLVLSDADTVRLATQPTLIPVRSVVPDDAEDVQDLAPIVHFPRAIWPWVLLGGLILLAAIVGYLLYRRRRRRPAAARPAPPPIPPYQEAVQRLKSLAEFDLDRDADVKPFYVELSDILRTYIERRAGVPALESTTRELIRHLERAQMSGFPSTAVARVRVVLETADLVKFADARPAAHEGNGSAVQVREIVDEVEDSIRARESQPTPAEDSAAV